MEKIYLVFGYYGVGGAQRRAAVLANELADRGYDVTFLAALGSNGSITEHNYYRLSPNVRFVLLPDHIQAHQDEPKIEQIIISNEQHELHIKKLQHAFYRIPKVNDRLNRSLRITRSTKQLSAYFALHRPGTVICFGFNLFERVYIAAAKYHHKVIYAGTNSIQKHKLETNFRYTLNLLQKADALVLQTKEQHNELGVRHPNAYVIHNPLTQGLPEPYRGQRKKIIVNFCALKRHKNLILLLRAFQKLVTSDPAYANYRLHLYSDSPQGQSGGDQEYRAEILSFIQDNRLEGRAELLPMTADVHQKILDCSMFVSSSNYEGISNSMLEAMAIGLPCVCTDCVGGGAREFIRDGYNGLLVECGDPNALYAAMKRMIDDPAFAESCGRNSAKIRDELTSEVVADHWERVRRSV